MISTFYNTLYRFEFAEKEILRERHKGLGVVCLSLSPLSLSCSRMSRLAVPETVLAQQHYAKETKQLREKMRDRLFFEKTNDFFVKDLMSDEKIDEEKCSVSHSRVGDAYQAAVLPTPSSSSSEEVVRKGRYSVLVRVLSVRQFSKSLKILTGILVQCNATNAGPQKHPAPIVHSRVHVLVRKGKNNADEFSKVGRLEEALSKVSLEGSSATVETAGKKKDGVQGGQDVILRCDVVLDLKRDQPVQTTGGATVLKCTKLYSHTVQPTSILPKTFRHREFATFCTANFAQSIRNGHLLDVAGGKGKLSVHLLHQNASMASSTVIDPATKKEYFTKVEYLENVHFSTAVDLVECVAKQKYRLSAQPTTFDEFEANNKNHCTQNVTAVFGLHPDQATDYIFDFSLQHELPFACIPCCVFKETFPHRALKSGQKVSRYGGFIQYLREKDSRIRIARLPFTGRNLVLYMRPEDYRVQKGKPENGLWRDDGWFSAPPPALPSKGKNKKSVKEEVSNEEVDHGHSSDSDGD